VDSTKVSTVPPSASQRPALAERSPMASISTPAAIGNQIRTLSKGHEYCMRRFFVY
jgi:hypothetical protein